MTKLLIFVGMFVGGLVVGYIVPSSWGIMWAFFISGLRQPGPVVYLGWKFARYLER